MPLYCWKHRSTPLWCAALHAFDKPSADGNHEAHGVVEQRPLGQTTPPRRHPAHLHPVSVPSTHLYSINGSAVKGNASTDTHKSRPQPAPSRVIRRPRLCQAPTSSWPHNPTPTTSLHHPGSVPFTHLYSVNGSAFKSNASTDTHKSRPQPAPSRVIRRPRSCQAPTSSWPRNPTPTTSPHLLPTSLADFATPQPAPSHVIQCLLLQSYP